MASARPLAVACLCLKKDRTAAGCAFRSSLSPVAVGVAWRGHGGRYGPIYGWRAFPVRRHAKIFRRAARFGAESGMVARRRPSKWRTWEPAAGTRQACRPPCRRPRRAAAQRPPWRHGRLSSPDAGPRAADCSTAFAGLRCPLAPDGPPSRGSHAAAAGFCALSPPPTSASFRARATGVRAPDRHRHAAKNPSETGIVAPPLADWAISYCDHWLVDRTFFSVAAMSEFGRADEGFLMYAKMTPGIKKALAEYEDGKRGAVSEHVVKSGRAKFRVLAFVKKAKTGRTAPGRRPSFRFFQTCRGAASRAAARDEKEAGTRVGASRRQDVKAHDGEQQPLDQGVHVPGIPCRCEHAGHDGPRGRH